MILPRVCARPRLQLAIRSWRVDRIAIIGCGGSGKSHLARVLGGMLGVMPVHLDGVCYDRDWKPLHKEQFAALQRDLVIAPQWIIDGNYASSLPIRLEAADTVIFLDFPAWACLWGIAQRRLRHGGGQHDSIGVYDRITWNFIRYIAGYRRQMAPRVRQLMRTTRGMPRWSCWAAAAPHAGTSSASSSGDLLPRRSLRLRSAANRFADSAQLHVALYDSLHRIGPGPREIHGHVAPAAPGIGCGFRARPARHVPASPTPGPTSSSPAKNDSTSAREWLCQVAAVYSVDNFLPSASSSLHATEMARQLPGVVRRAYPAAAARGASASRKCRTAARMTHTGSRRSITARSCGSASTAAGSRRSAATAVTPSLVASSAWAWESTTGSTST